MVKQERGPVVKVLGEEEGEVGEREEGGGKGEGREAPEGVCCVPKTSS